MHGAFGNASAVAREIQGQFRPGRDKIVPNRKFGVVARALWPDKTAFHVAAIANCEERQAKRYLSGEYDVPYVVIRAVVDAMLGIEIP